MTMGQLSAVIIVTMERTILAPLIHGCNIDSAAIIRRCTDRRYNLVPRLPLLPFVGGGVRAVTTRRHKEDTGTYSSNRGTYAGWKIVYSRSYALHLSTCCLSSLSLTSLRPDRGTRDGKRVKGSPRGSSSYVHRVSVRLFWGL